MKDERQYFLKQVNYLKMCQNDKARLKIIEKIFADGVQEGWKQSGCD